MAGATPIGVAGGVVEREATGLREGLPPEVVLVADDDTGGVVVLHQPAARVAGSGLGVRLAVDEALGEHFGARGRVVHVDVGEPAQSVVFGAVGEAALAPALGGLAASGRKALGLAGAAEPECSPEPSS